MSRSEIGSRPPSPAVVGEGEICSPGALNDRPPQKLKGRQRLLESLQRISSSPSLVHLGRPRAAGSPYKQPRSFSCVSLASSSTASPFSGADSYFSHASTADQSSAPTSISGTPIYDGIEAVLAVRKVDSLSLLASRAAASLPAGIRRKTRQFSLWANMPYEIKIQVLSFLMPRELICASRVSKDFYSLCFDGQLWTCFDASEFYQDIPAESMAKIIVAAGPFIKHLNLRGCVQVEHYKRAEMVVKACKNLVNATLEGCRNFQRTTLHSLLRNNAQLARLNLTGLVTVTNTTCKIIAHSCPQLEMLNVSWCKHMDARGIKTVVENCAMLQDLRAGEIRGFDNLDVADVIFTTNRLERLVLAGCEDLTDAALQVMVRGSHPEFDILTELPLVEPRKLRHLDLSRCTRLTSQGVKVLGHMVPDLQGLQLSRLASLTDAALEPILESTPCLTHLELEELSELTDSLLSNHLAKAPCARKLDHLSISSCENLGDAGMLPVMRNCVSLRSVDMDNTRISNLTLAEASTLVAKSMNKSSRNSRPRVGLSLVIYDCQNVTWTGILEVLSRNSETRSATRRPTQIIALKCFYGWQMTVDEHTKRVLRGDFQAASRLEQKWAEYMQANEEAGLGGSGTRRRRRRAREAQQMHANEEEGAGVHARRRARTAACMVM